MSGRIVVFALVALAGCEPPNAEGPRAIPAAAPIPPPPPLRDLPVACDDGLSLDDRVELTVSPIRYDDLRQAPSCGGFVSWTETLVRIERCDPAMDSCDGVRPVRLMCAPAVPIGLCLRFEVPRVRLLDTVATHWIAG